MVIFDTGLRGEKGNDRRNYDEYSVEKRLCSQRRERIIVQGGKHMAPRTQLLLPRAGKTLLTRHSVFPARFNLIVFFISTRLENCLKKGISEGKKSSITLQDKEQGFRITQGFPS